MADHWCRDCGEDGTEYIYNLDDKEVWLCDQCYHEYMNPEDE